MTFVHNLGFGNRIKLLDYNRVSSSKLTFLWALNQKQKGCDKILCHRISRAQNVISRQLCGNIWSFRLKYRLRTIDTTQPICGNCIETLPYTAANTSTTHRNRTTTAFNQTHLEIVSHLISWDLCLVIALETSVEPCICSIQASTLAKWIKLS